MLPCGPGRASSSSRRGRASPAHGRDMSQATVRAAAPLVGRDYGASTCPLAPTRCPYGGACHACPARVQAKLAVNEPGDLYEQEADRIAGQIVQTPAMQVQRRAASGPELTDVPPIVHEVLRSPGQPLDAHTRAFMEPRFGHDFSRVRVHSGVTADQSAREINADAYTAGHNIVFGAGQYRPSTACGQRLIAHELAHVVQQRSTHGSCLMRELAPQPAPTMGTMPQGPSRPATAEDRREFALEAVRFIESQGEFFALPAGSRHGASARPSANDGSQCVDNHRQRRRIRPDCRPCACRLQRRGAHGAGVANDGAAQHGIRATRLCSSCTNGIVTTSCRSHCRKPGRTPAPTN